MHQGDKVSNKNSIYIHVFMYMCDTCLYSLQYSCHTHSPVHVCTVKLVVILINSNYTSLFGDPLPNDNVLLWPRYLLHVTFSGFNTNLPKPLNIDPEGHSIAVYVWQKC